VIYAGGHISGGHYNPAVTLAALVRGRIGLGDAAGYRIAQLAEPSRASRKPGMGEPELRRSLIHHRVQFPHRQTIREQPSYGHHPPLPKPGRAVD
jgi:hypothetical protein